MMFMLNCIFVFILMFICDVVWAAYFRFINDKEAMPASICGVLIYLFGSLVTIKWMEDYRFLLPAMAGAFCGTFIAVKVMK